MTNPQPIELDVHLLLAGEDVSGTVQRAGHPSVPFSGWLGLLGAVQRAAEAAAPEPDLPRSPPGPAPALSELNNTPSDTTQEGLNVSP